MKPEKVMRLMKTLIVSAGGFGWNASSWILWAVIMPHTSNVLKMSRSADRPPAPLGV